MTEVDWSWLAGVFEGEGSVIMRDSIADKRGVRHRHLYVNISQKDPSMLHEVHRIAQLGCIHPANRKDGSELFMWQASCAAARKFLVKIQPYIRSEPRKSRIVELLRLDAELRSEGKNEILKVLAAGRAERLRRIRERQPNAMRWGW